MFEIANDKYEDFMEEIGKCGLKEALKRIEDRKIKKVGGRVKMTVRELIDKLQKIENKNMEVSMLYEIWDEYSEEWEDNYSNIYDIHTENFEGTIELVLDGRL